MKRLVLALAIVLATRRAEAAMMQHLDLAGLVLRSESIAIVDRVAPGRFHVVERLHGSIAIGIELALDDSLYDFPAGTDKRMYAFLAKRGMTYDLVPSGLRIVVGGSIDRYEQWNNPGGWTAVPQGQDPRDQWQQTAQLGRADLAFAIGDAVRRVALLPVVRAERDPIKRRTAALALLAPRGDATAPTFYVDALAAEVRDLLVAGGDLEGALLADQHDHGEMDLRPEFATVKALVDYAGEPSHPSVLRAGALTALMRRPTGVITDPPLAERVIALLADADPAVRAAAVPVAGVVATVDGDPDTPSTIANRKTAKAALANRYHVETDTDALYALASLQGDERRHSKPAKAAPPAVARVRFGRGALVVDAICLQPSARATSPQLTAVTAAGSAVAITASEIDLHCHGEPARAPEQLPPPGRYAIAFALAVDGNPFVQPLGTLEVDATGEAVLSR